LGGEFVNGFGLLEDRIPQQSPEKTACGGFSLRQLSLSS